MSVHRAFTAMMEALPKPVRRHRRCIAVDETKLKVERRSEEGLKAEKEVQKEALKELGGMLD